MKITVVGFWHGYPEKHEATSCYLLQADGYNLLLDCGSGALSVLAQFCPHYRIDAVVLSHYHHDHMADIGPLQYASLMENNRRLAPLTIYGPYDEAYVNVLSYKNVVKEVLYDEADVLSVGPFTFTFMKTLHPKTCYAMKIIKDEKTIVYTADTSFFQNLVSFSANVNMLITECSGYKGDVIAQYGHMTSTCVGRLAKKAKPKKVLLTHLPHAGDHTLLKEEVCAHFNGDVLMARTGKTIHL